MRALAAVLLLSTAAYLWSRSGQTAITSGYEYAEDIMDKLTRGERNNNPGNIDQSNIHWLGKLARPTDSRFEQFESPFYGIRALASNLLTYWRRYGLNTVRGIVNRWAPPVENATDSYVSAVANDVGVAPDDPLSLADPLTLARLTRAIIRHENGRVIYDDDVIRQAVHAAYG